MPGGRRQRFVNGCPVCGSERVRLDLSDVMRDEAGAPVITLDFRRHKIEPAKMQVRCNNPDCKWEGTLYQHGSEWHLENRFVVSFRGKTHREPRSQNA